MIDPIGDGRLRVLCIAATGQSGSTLLTRMLGELPGFVAAGEIGRLWDKGVGEDLACSCGEPFSSCPFWTQVGELAFGGWTRVDGAEVARLRDSLALRELPLPHPFALPFLLHPNVWPGYRTRLQRYIGFMRPVYAAIHELSGGRVIVDSMKIPAHVYMMAEQVTDLDVRVAHLVRDSRGFAYSNVKWVERQGAVEGAFRNRRPPWKSGVRWLWFNAAFDHLERRGVPTVSVRYERLVANPRPELGSVAALMDAPLPPGALDFVHEDGVDLRPGHVVSRSRSRRTSGRIPLREDLEWTTKLPSRDRRVVTVITRPLLRRYGYAIERDPADGLAGPGRLPNLIVAGVGKAGTTSLFWYLSQHREVCASKAKEIRYFTSLTEGDGSLPPVEEYANHFRHCGGGRYRLEASPQYFHGGRPIIDAMRELLGSPRVIVMFRDPVDRLWSTYRFMRSRMSKLPAGMTFERYVAACREVRDRREPLSSDNRLYWTIQGGFYAEYLGEWVEAFGDGLRVVFFEHLVVQPEMVVRDLCRWLGIDDGAAAGFTYSVENRTVQYRSKLLQRVALAANSERLLGGRRRLKDPLRRLYYALNRSPQDGRMSAEARRELEELFAPGNAALAEELRRLGYRDLPEWLRGAVSEGAV